MKKKLLRWMLAFYFVIGGVNLVALPGCGSGDEPTGDPPTEEQATPDYIKGEKAANRR